MTLQNCFYNLNAYYGLIKIQGARAEAFQFLQSLLTCDIDELKTKDHCFGALCNLKGRVRALFRIFKFPEQNLQDQSSHDINLREQNSHDQNSNDQNLHNKNSHDQNLHDQNSHNKNSRDQNSHFYLLTIKALIPSLVPILKKHALFSKLSFVDASETFNIGGCTEAYRDIFDNLLNCQKSESAPLSFETLLTIDTKKPRYILIASKNAPNSVFNRWIEVQNKEQENNRENYLDTAWETWQYMNIQAQIPEIFPETSEKFLPHHLNLPALGAVSFTKGCYFGQEIIARMEYKGNIKYYLKHLMISKDDPMLQDNSARGVSSLVSLSGMRGMELSYGQEKIMVVNSAKTNADSVALLCIHCPH